jgi:hypothetical protein
VNKLLDANIMTAALVILSAALLGQYAAHGLSLMQGISGVAAVGGSIALAVIVRTWPKPQTPAGAEG